MHSASIFYVYEHWRPDTGQCFYVGKGCRKRAWAMMGRNWRHHAVQEKLKTLGLSVEVRLVLEKLTHGEAIAYEMGRIGFYGRRNLVNMTEGGEGPIGRVATPEHRAKISALMTGRKLTPETLAKMSAALKGIRPSAETRAKLSAARAGKKRDPSIGQKIAAALRGKPKSAEHRAKCSAWQIGRKMPQESIEKTRLGCLGKKRPQAAIEATAAAHRGKKRSPEVRARIAEGIRAAKALKQAAALGTRTALPGVEYGIRI